MLLFHFLAKDSDGQTVEGEKEAADKYDLARVLRLENLSPISIEEKQEKGINKIEKVFSGIFERVSLEEKMNFARNVGVMVGSGVSLSRVFEIISRQTNNQKFKSAILDMDEFIKKGGTFGDALAKHGKIFPKFFVEMVRSGEKSGTLEGSLQIISLQLKKDYALRKKIKSAAAYPVIVVIAMVAIGVLMMIYVVPSLTKTFSELAIELPASTAFVIFLSDFIVGHSFVFGTISAFIIFGGFYFFRSRVGHSFSDFFFSHVPPFKEINRKFNAARTCRTLSSLLDAGVDVVEALEITKEVLNNHLYKNVLLEASDIIKKGEQLSRAFLSKQSLYPPLVGEMIGIGEETGKLSPMLLKLAQFYENEVSVDTKDLSTVIEPILMLIVGAAVGFFAISMISPMYNLAGGF
ncbi:MAG: type II secretion system F family protein [Patescibacteria group bacterium]